MPVTKGTKLPRFTEATKQAVITAIKQGERIDDIARKFGIKNQTIYGFLYYKGMTIRRLRKSLLRKSEKVNPTTDSATTNYENKLRLISFYCGVNRETAMQGCVDFYFKHLKSIVTEQIKQA